MATVKVFISQPMRGLSNEEIEKERMNCFAEVGEALQKAGFKDTALEVVDSFFKDAPHDANPLWFLGEAIKKMSEADIAVFARGWHNARGCVVEHECARRYGVLMVGTAFTDLSLRGVDVYKLEKQQ